MHTKEGLASISKANKGKKRSRKFKASMSERLLGNQYALGHEHSEATKLSMSNSAKGRPVSILCRQKSSERAIKRNKGNTFAKGYRWTSEQLLNHPRKKGRHA